MEALRVIALRYPEAEEGIACRGTSLECSTFKARKKAFLFIGAANVRVKLQDSLAEAAKLAAKEPDRYKVGAHGWVEVKFTSDEPPPLEVLERWIDESYRLLVPKQLAETLPERGSTPVAKSKPKQKPRRK